MNELIIEGKARAIVSTFDYSQLNGDESKAARDARDRIRRRITSQIEAIIETGEDLIQVKELLGHGRFTGWIEAEFGMSQRTATNYMRAADAFRGKTEIIADLPAATVYALAAVPPETRESIIEEIGSKAPPTEQQVRDALWTARQEQKRIASDAKLSPRQRKSRAQREADAAKNRARMEVERRKAQDAATRAVAIIVEALSDEQAATVSELLPAAKWLLLDELRASLEARASDIDL